MVVDRKAERQALQLLQRAEMKQRDELEQRATLKRSALGQQLDQRRQVTDTSNNQTVAIIASRLQRVSLIVIPLCLSVCRSFREPNLVGRYIPVLARM